MVHLLLRHTTTLGVPGDPGTGGIPCPAARTPWTPPGAPWPGKPPRDGASGRQKPEFEDLARIAREQGLTLDQVRDGLK